MASHTSLLLIKPHLVHRALSVVLIFICVVGGPPIGYWPLACGHAEGKPIAVKIPHLFYTSLAEAEDYWGI